MIFRRLASPLIGVVTALIALGLPGARALTHEELAHPSGRWAGGDPVTFRRSQNNQTIEARAFALQSSSGRYQVGTVLVLKLPPLQIAESTTSTSPESALSLALGLEIGPGQALQIRKTRSGTTYIEGHWLSQRRVLRMAQTTTHSGARIISVALGRAAYQNEFLSASLSIQKPLHEGIEASVLIPTLRELESFFWSEAHAQTTLPPACTATCPPPPLGSTCQINKTNCLSTQFVTTVTNQGAAANANWANTNAILGNFLQPESAFIWAAAGATGAMLGSLAVSAAVDGIVAGGSALLEAITHAKSETEIISSFKTARETWEKLSTSAQDLERSLDIAIELHDASRELLKSDRILTRQRPGELPNQTLERLIRSELAEKSAMLALRQEELKEAARVGAHDRIEACSIQVGELAAETELLEKLKENLQISFNEDAKWCRDLETKFDQLLLAEQKLQHVRARVLGTERGLKRSNIEVFEEHLGQEHESAADRLDRSIEIKSRQRNLKEALERAQRTHETESARAEAIREDYMRTCMRNSTSPAIRDIPLIGYPMQLRNSNQCQAEFLSSRAYKQYTRAVEAATAARDSSIGSARQTYGQDTFKSPMPRAHAESLSLELASYRRWFRELEQDQLCLSDPVACHGQELETTLAGRIQALKAKGERLSRRCSGS